MPSQTRERVFETMEEYRKILNPDDKNWRVLEVGIDGDSFPGGNFQYFGRGNLYETLDFLERLHPTYIEDIQETNLPDNFFDLIICSQTLEHVYEPVRAIKEIYRITNKGGFAILDCPFEHPYHPTGDYGDYWRMTQAILTKVAENAGFEVISNMSTNLLTSILVRRPI